jgi:hypothetical protein
MNVGQKDNTPPRSKGRDDNKRLYELEHGFFYGAECQELLDLYS